MTEIGLSHDKLVEILKEGIVNGEVDADKISNAIAKAIVKNNEKIEKQVPGLVSGKMMDGLRARGIR